MNKKLLMSVITLVFSILIAPAASVANASVSIAPGAPKPDGHRSFLPVAYSPGNVSVSLEAEPRNVEPGQRVLLRMKLTTAAARSAVVEVILLVTDPAGREVFRRKLSSQNLAASSANEIAESVTLDGAATEGAYNVGVQVQNSASGLTLYDNKAAGSFGVRKGATPAPTSVPTQTRAATATPPVTTVPPTATAAPPTKTPTPQPSATRTPAPTPTPATSGSIYWGVNMQGVPWDLAKLSAWEQNVTGKAVSVINWGHFWGNSSGGYQNWSSGAPNNARSHGSIPLISWTPEGGDAARWQLADIINGSHDAYIRQFATDAKNWGYPFFLRMMHEMNGTWGYNWQETQNGNQRGQFITAWKHIVDIFRSVGNTNASFVWCPNIDFPGTTNPTFASLYPGDAYVDWTCLDGYNWGSTRSTGWQTFDQVYNYSYNEVLKVAPSKPMMIGEFGSVEQGGSKSAWFTDAMTTQIPQRYPKLRAVLYFNWQFSGVDWRIETTTTAQDAWKRGIASSYYYGNVFGGITGKVPVP